MNGIDKVQQVESQIITMEQLKPLRDMIAKGATDAELVYFATYANRVGLDPIQKQIHFVARASSKGERQITFQTGIDGFRLIAERSGAYAGSDDYIFNDGKTEFELRDANVKHPTTATATVYKIVQGIRVSFSATAAWVEYYPGDAKGFMWNKMPFNQLGKCAEAKALRKAFPNLAGLYTDDEMQQANTSIKNAPTSDKNTPKIQDVLKAINVLSQINSKDEFKKEFAKYRDMKDDPRIVDLIEKKKLEFENVEDAEINDMQSEILEDEESELIFDEPEDKKVIDVIRDINNSKTLEEVDKILADNPTLTTNTFLIKAVEAKKVKLK